jgi:hypothetical protein
MSLTAIEVAFLRRLVSHRPPARAGKTALSLALGHHTGRAHQSKVLYEERDYAAAANALTTRGFDLAAPAVGGTRSEQGPGGSEKWGARAVTDGLVAVVPLNMGMQLPQGTRFLAADGSQVARWDFDVILECENLEPLLQLDQFTWLGAFICGRPTLAVYRGDPRHVSTSAAAQLVREVGKPVLGFYDFDPAGLAMAASEPRLEALCLPPWDQLEAAVAAYRREELYLAQVQERRAQLDAVAGGPVADAWRRIRRLQSGLNQENFPR